MNEERENMQIAKEIARLRGLEDERLVAEKNAIYAKGFIALSLGTALVLCYQFMLDQVSSVEEVPLQTPVGQALVQPALLLLIVLMATCIACCIAQCAKGFADTNQYGEADRFPAEHYLTLSGLLSAAFALVIAGLRIVAEWQIMGFDAILWLPDLAVGIVFGTMFFVMLSALFYASFVAAKRRRARTFDD